MKLLPLLALTFGISTAIHALTEQEIQGYINDAIKAGGGEVVIPPGTHMITKGLVIQDAKKLRLIGLDAERCILKLPPLAYAEVSEAAPAGSTRIVCKRLQNLHADMLLQIEAEGEIDCFTQKPKPYHLAKLKAIGGLTLILHEPLKFAAPAGTLIRDPHAPNLIEVRGSSDFIGIEKLTLDGGRVESDPPVRGHAQLCGVFASGDYTYEGGPKQLVKDVIVSRCIIQHCHGRGVAFYAAEGGKIEGNVIMDCTDEAMDLDHFTIKTTVRHNHAARCLVAVEMNDASNCVVSANEFMHCGTGINLWRWCKQQGLNEGNQITGNSFLNMAGNGIQISQGTANNTITDNDIVGSGKNGIIVTGGKQTIQDNRISGSGLKDVVGNAAP
jgi:parallel beta-helix repeat protein